MVRGFVGLQRHRRLPAQHRCRLSIVSSHDQDCCSFLCSSLPAQPACYTVCLCCCCFYCLWYMFPLQNNNNSGSSRHIDDVPSTTMTQPNQPSEAMSHLQLDGNRCPSRSKESTEVTRGRSGSQNPSAMSNQLLREFVLCRHLATDCSLLQLPLRFPVTHA